MISSLGEIHSPARWPGLSLASSLVLGWPMGALGAMPRLYLDADLESEARIALDEAQTRYLVDVMRLKPGAEILAFNGRDGNFPAR